MIDLFQPAPAVTTEPTRVHRMGEPKPRERVVAAPSKRERPPVTSQKRRAQMAAHYQANKADYAARSKKWMAEHPAEAREAWKQSERRRRAKRKAIGAKS